MKPSRCLTLRIITVLALIVVGISCQRASSPTPRTPVTLATSKNVWCTLALVALDRGFFADEGLDVDVKYLDAGRYCLDAVVSESADFGTIVEVNVAYHGFTTNENLAVVGTLAASTSSAIIARKSAGIQSPADLSGKTLALSPGTTSDIFAHRFLAANKLSAANVTLRKIQPTALQPAMISRDIDAASTWEPFVHNIKTALGDDAVVFTAPTIYTAYEMLAVRRDWAHSHTTQVDGFLKALKKAERFVLSNPSEAQAIVSRAINLDPSTVTAIWSLFDFNSTHNRATLLAAIRAEGEQIRANDESFTSKPLPNYEPYVTDEFSNRIQ